MKFLGGKMITDVAGKVRNLKLRPTERLVPLFEAIVNSIQASQELAVIEIEVIRQMLQSTTDLESDKFQEVESFCIQDYGSGFNEDNLESFKTAESSYKAHLGCKGVGRFTWLKAFEVIEVESIYKTGDILHKVKFDFSIDNEDLNEVQPAIIRSNSITPFTKVTLKNVKSPYKEKMPVDLEEYCDEIVQHCITYFLDNKFATFLIKDNTGCKIDLIDYFRKNYSSEIISSDMTISNLRFKTFYVKTYGRQKKHKVVFCANSRKVKEYDISSYVDNIPDYFFDDNKEKFRYSIYVSSSYLDNNVNQERTGFSISDKEDFLDDDAPSVQTIIGEVILNCDSIFAKYLEPMLSENILKIKNYVETKGYEYRVLLKHRPEWIKNIKIGLTDDDLDLELHCLLRNFENELKQEARRIKSELKESKVLSTGDYKLAYEKYTGALNDLGKSNLARHIIHRKAIIDIFELSLELQESDKYALESAVHDIIFPMNSTSDDVAHISQNLWLIDERMSYHTLLASDQPFSKFSNIKDNSRPDLLIFNNPIVFSEDDKRPMTATIIEFKRPMRDDYNDEENPVRQVIGYVKKLREPNGIKNINGRVINLSHSAPVYCYIICDLTKSIREHAADHDYIATPDNEGYIWYHKKFNAYIEIISFDKLAVDARKRNNILFKALNIE